MNANQIMSTVLDASKQLASIQLLTDPASAGDTVLVDTLAELTELTGIIGDIKMMIEGEVLNRYAAGDDIAGSRYVATVGKRPSKVSTDWPRLKHVAIAEMIERRNVDTETGEAETIADCIARQIGQLVPMTASVKPKTTGAAELGIDLERYQQKEWGPAKVRLVLIDDEAVAA